MTAAFAALVAAGERCDLARAALEIARIGHPDLDPTPSLARLDALAAGARARVASAAAPEAAAEALAHHLFRECGFHGNQDDYDDPRNSFLNDVLERRTGLPISLAVVLMETGGRLGIPVEGVGFPGHFLVRVAGRTGPVLLDPFFGRAIGADELLARWRTVAGAAGEPADRVPPAALQRAAPPAILARMLRNLLHVYLGRDDLEHGLATVERLLVVVPDAPDLLRVRGLLYERLECFAAALGDLRRYLALRPDAPDAADVRARVARLAPRAATLH